MKDEGPGTDKRGPRTSNRRPAPQEQQRKRVPQQEDSVQRVSSRPSSGRPARQSAPPRPVIRPPAFLVCQAEVFAGLEDLAWAEIEGRFGRQVHRLAQGRAGEVRFQYLGSLPDLLGLRRVLSVSLVQRFPVPRPKALLGHQHFETLIALIQKIRVLHPAAAFTNFRISAAGEDSAVFSRLKAEIAARTGLDLSDEGGDLLLAVRPALEGGEGWEVAIRLSPRPLAARSWRVCNLPGALNAAVASCMMALTSPNPGDRLLNLACGSATLLIECLALGPLRQAIGCDSEAAALTCAHSNLQAASYRKQVTLGQWDARHLPLTNACASVICADLPFGALVGSHHANAELYPQIFDEAARVAIPGARFVLITQEVRLTERLLAERQGEWLVRQTIRITIPTNTALIKPCLYLLERV